MQAITLNQLAVALLGAGAYIYHISQRSGWTACAIVCGCRIERSSPDPYAALGAVAQVLIESEAQQAAQDLVLTPAARAAYKAAWAASEGQPVSARFAAAEAAAAATEAADWPSTIRTEQSNARTMQRLRSITGRASAAEAAPAASGDEQPAEEELSGWCHQRGCTNRCRKGPEELCEECRREQEDEAEEAAQEELAEHNARFDWWESLTDAQREAQIKFALR